MRKSLSNFSFFNNNYAGVVAGGLSCMGLIFCLLNALGIETFCTTSGCEITSGFSLFGVSFYWFGALGFLLILLLLLFTKNNAKALFFASFLLAGDIIFLFVMVFMPPCLSCLIVGVLFFSIVIILFFQHKNNLLIPSRLINSALILWIVFFVPNFLNLSSEFIGPSPVYGTANAPIKIFFSPTCPACKDMVIETMENNKGQVALYPVGKGVEDFRGICALNCQYSQTEDIDTALNACWSNKCENTLSSIEQIELAFKIWRNKKYLFDIGKNTVPVMITQKLPKFKIAKNKSPDFFSNGCSTSSGIDTGCEF